MVFANPSLIFSGAGLPSQPDESLPAGAVPLALAVRLADVVLPAHDVRLAGAVLPAHDVRLCWRGAACSRGAVC